MGRFGAKAEITMGESLEGKGFIDIEAFDYIYLEGSNPFILLNEIKKAKFMPALTEYAKSKRPIYGQSAGALVLGKDMFFAEVFGENAKNVVGLKDTTGADLLMK